MSAETFMLMPDAPAGHSSPHRPMCGEAAALLARADRLEREAEDLRMEAMEADEQARNLRARARALAFTEVMDETDLLESVIEYPAGFARHIIDRVGKHPMLAPLRRILARLDALADAIRERETRRMVESAIQPIAALLHTRELCAYTERMAA